MPDTNSKAIAAAMQKHLLTMVAQPLYKSLSKRMNGKQSKAGNIVPQKETLHKMLTEVMKPFMDKIMHEVRLEESRNCGPCLENQDTKSVHISQQPPAHCSKHQKQETCLLCCHVITHKAAHAITKPIPEFVYDGSIKATPAVLRLRFLVPAAQRKTIRICNTGYKREVHKRESTRQAFVRQLVKAVDAWHHVRTFLLHKCLKRPVVPRTFAPARRATRSTRKRRSARRRPRSPAPVYDEDTAFQLAVQRSRADQRPVKRRRRNMPSVDVDADMDDVDMASHDVGAGSGFAAPAAAATVPVDDMAAAAAEPAGTSFGEDLEALYQHLPEDEGMPLAEPDAKDAVAFAIAAAAGAGATSELLAPSFPIGAGCNELNLGCLPQPPLTSYTTQQLSSVPIVQPQGVPVSPLSSGGDPSAAGPFFSDISDVYLGLF